MQDPNDTSLYGQINFISSVAQNLKGYESKYPYTNEDNKKEIRDAIEKLQETLLESVRTANESSSFGKAQIASKLPVKVDAKDRKRLSKFDIRIDKNIKSMDIEKLSQEEEYNDEIIITNPCEVCQKDYKKLNCFLEKHHSPKIFVSTKNKYGPVSIGETWILTRSEAKNEYKRRIILNCFEITKKDDEACFLARLRNGLIIQYNIMDEDEAIETWVSNQDEIDSNVTRTFYKNLLIHDFDTNITVNKKGLPYKLDEFKVAKSIKPEYNLLERGSLQRKSNTETCTSFLYNYNDKDTSELEMLSLEEPNIYTILSQAYGFEGRELELINRAFVIVRRVQVYKKFSGNDNEYFFEPVFVQIEKQRENSALKTKMGDNKDSDIPDYVQHDPNKTQLIRIFYLAKQNNRFEIRAILAKTRDIRKVACQIMEEQIYEKIYKTDFKELPNVKDRRIGIKVRVEDGKIDEQKEYMMESTVLKSVMTITRIKTGNSKHVRYKTKPNNYSEVKDMEKLEKKKATLDFFCSEVCKDRMGTRKILRQTETSMEEELIEPCMKIIIKCLLETNKKTPDNQQTPKMNISELKAIKFYCYTSLKFWKENLNGEMLEGSEKNFKKLMLVHCEIDKHVESGKLDEKLVPSTEECERLQKLKGLYMLNKDENEKIEFHPEMKIQEVLSLNSLQHPRGHTADILKTVVLTPNGTILSEIELKVNIVKLNKNIETPQSIDFKENPKNAIPELTNFEDSEIINSCLKTEQTKLKIKTSWVVQIDSETLILVEVEEPNICAIIPHRLHHSEECLDSQCEFELFWKTLRETNSYFTENSNLLANDIQMRISENMIPHDRNCNMRSYGQFIIISNVKIIKLKMKSSCLDAYGDQKIEEELLEMRYEPKIVKCVCNSCSDANIILHYGDKVSSDVCYSTMSWQILSRMDARNALEIMLKETELATTESDKDLIRSRFLMRIHRAMSYEKQETNK